MLDYYNDHGLVGNGNVLRMILKRDPTTFLAAAKRELTSRIASDALKPSVSTGRLVAAQPRSVIMTNEARGNKCQD
jgi:hypothetical protein